VVSAEEVWGWVSFSLVVVVGSVVMVEGRGGSWLLSFRGYYSNAGLIGS
jgi:hypothetical protein